MTLTNFGKPQTYPELRLSRAICFCDYCLAILLLSLKIGNPLNGGNSGQLGYDDTKASLWQNLSICSAFGG